VNNAKSVAFSVPEIIVGAKKIGQGSPWIRSRWIPLIENFIRLFVRKHPINARAKFEVRIALPVSELIGGSKNWAGPVYAFIAYPPKKSYTKCLYTRVHTANRRSWVRVGSGRQGQR